MPAALQLSAVERATSVGVSLALFNCVKHLVDWHLAILHLAVPNAERSTRWRLDDPFRIVIAYHLARQLCRLSPVSIAARRDCVMPMGTSIPEALETPPVLAIVVGKR